MLAVLHLHLYLISAVFVLAALHCCWCLNACCAAVLDVHLHVYSISALFVLLAPHCCWCLNACCVAVIDVLTELAVLDVH